MLTQPTIAVHKQHAYLPKSLPFPPDVWPIHPHAVRRLRRIDRKVGILAHGLTLLMFTFATFLAMPGFVFVQSRMMDGAVATWVLLCLVVWFFARKSLRVDNSNAIASLQKSAILSPNDLLQMIEAILVEHGYTTPGAFVHVTITADRTVHPPRLVVAIDSAGSLPQHTLTLTEPQHAALVLALTHKQGSWGLPPDGTIFENMMMTSHMSAHQHLAILAMLAKTRTTSTPHRFWTRSIGTTSTPT